MKECIYREAAIAVIYGQHVGGKEACENARPNTYGADLREIVAGIEDIPSADVRPVVRGRWKRNERGNYNCSNCKSEHKAVFGFAFCPNCGADMREES